MAKEVGGTSDLVFRKGHQLGRARKKKIGKKDRIKARKEAERKFKPMAEERVHGTRKCLLASRRTRMRSLQREGAIGAAREYYVRDKGKAERG